MELFDQLIESNETNLRMTFDLFEKATLLITIIIESCQRIRLMIVDETQVARNTTMVIKTKSENSKLYLELRRV